MMARGWDYVSLREETHMTKKQAVRGVDRLKKQLDKMRIAFALVAIHVQELEAHVTEDTAAIKHPKPKAVKKTKKAK